jgi:hypothetical protein
MTAEQDEKGKKGADKNKEDEKITQYSDGKAVYRIGGKFKCFQNVEMFFNNVFCLFVVFSFHFPIF